jgi:hypothetical protein
MFNDVVSTTCISRLVITHATSCYFLITYWLSQPTQIVDIGFGQYKISHEKFKIHLIFSNALTRFINFDSIMDLVIHIFSEDFYNIADLSLY